MRFVRDLKDCTGCCFLFGGKVNGNDYKLCRRYPPRPIVVRGPQNEDRVQSWYPEAPLIRCGEYKRDWLWLMR